MKASIDIQDPIAQKIAVALVTKHMRDKFNLHPLPMAKGIVEEARKEQTEPKKLFAFLKATLPDLVNQFLAEVDTAIDREIGGKK